MTFVLMVNGNPLLIYNLTGTLCVDALHLIARTGGTIGKSYLVSDILIEAVFASYLIRVKKLSSTYPEYIKIFLRSLLYWGQLYESSMGTGQPNVNGNALKHLKLPLPPLAEQKRIVAKVDELMSLCDKLEQAQTLHLKTHQTLVKTVLQTLTDAADAAEVEKAWQRLCPHFDTLFCTEDSIDQLKQTVLQLAIMGRLVKQDPNDEPASELLKRIEKEKAKAVKEGRLKKQAPLPEIGEEEKPFALPSGWEWVRLGQLVLKSEAGKSLVCDKRPADKNEWGIIKVSAMSWGEFDEKENKALPQNIKPVEEYKIKEGDYLISRANTEELIGKSVVVKKLNANLLLSDKIN